MSEPAADTGAGPTWPKHVDHELVYREAALDEFVVEATTAGARVDMATRVAVEVLEYATVCVTCNLELCDLEPDDLHFYDSTTKPRIQS